MFRAMPRPRSTGAGRLSVDDWIQNGYAIVAEAGLAALKVDRLCDRLGVTKGSFYWHFDDMRAYRAALVAEWGRMRDEDRRRLDEMADLPPRERLSQMMSELVSTRHWTMERAMREWARSDDAVAAGVRAADRALVAGVRRALLDGGFDEEDADLRANAIFAAGVGFIHLSGPTPSARQAARRERFLDLMLRR
ncbi:TetR/AcrR family transcriptional regulator [Mycolicibacterium litorale]|uniref:TetR family transcriptional regulator n=2 Tax=Mycolicibacterium litorale TaxID=758802 RepID=A0AAD1MUF4_9MYCO|nr:TetR/AcrR family transcriptional regulator [Mycolicibacterium litorale]TDY09086.1 TetR family transcriptional regulator [Mycolicibacterium litorale]BBY17023.1 TetR family transcriptional regulator [Mycolicibacterium litorale]